jgi:hypothetical protein
VNASRAEKTLSLSLSLSLLLAYVARLSMAELFTLYTALRANYSSALSESVVANGRTDRIFDLASILAAARVARQASDVILRFNTRRSRRLILWRQRMSRDLPYRRRFDWELGGKIAKREGNFGECTDAIIPPVRSSPAPLSHSRDIS